MVRQLGILLILLWAVACIPTEQAPTAEPVATSTLIFPTSTFTPLPPTAIPTEANLPSPQDLLFGTPTIASPSSTNDGADALIARDPIAGELVRLAREQVAQLTDLPTRRIQLVDVTAAVWTDSSLNCPLPDTFYLPMLIDGYRIVLRAAEEEYIFHTDIDRVTYCDPENEQRPDVESTDAVEVTSETTDES